MFKLHTRQLLVMADGKDFPTDAIAEPVYRDLEQITARGFANLKKEIENKYPNLEVRDIND